MLKRGLVKLASEMPGGRLAILILVVARDAPTVARSPLFDQEYYEAQVGRRFGGRWRAAAHYVAHRRALRLAPHPLVEPEWCAPETDKGIPDPLRVLARRRATSPGPLFDTATYLERWPEALRYPGGPVVHFLARARDDAPLPTGPALPGSPPTLGEARQALLDEARRHEASQRLNAPRRTPGWRGSGQERDFLRAWVRRGAGPATAGGGAARPADAASPVVSVVMPVRNRPLRVLTAVESVRRQTLGDWELIVVDDGSNDGTAAGVARIAEQDPRITVVSLPPSGVCAARNAGLAAAHGRYVAFLDSDNQWVPHFLEVMVGYLGAHDLRAGYSVVDAGTEVADRYLAFEGGLEHLLVKNHVDLNAFVAERSVVEQAGGFDPGLRRWVDHDLVIRVAQLTDLRLVPFVGVAYDHGDDASDRITRSESEHWQYRVLAKHHLDWAKLRADLPGRVCGRVSICMPTFQDWTLTLRAVTRVLEDADAVSRMAVPRGAADVDGAGPDSSEPDVEVVVLDNGSRRAVSAILRAAFLAEPRVRLVSMPRNLNFSIGSNLAFAHSTGDIAVFLNNDTEVTRGWLTPLLEALQDPQVRGVQPLLLYPDGTVQSAGTVFLGGDTLPSPLLVDHPPDDARRAGELRLNVVTAAALAMRAADVVDLEGFDPLFVNGFEDVDLCLRAVQRYGGRFVVETRSVVVHHESRTPGRRAGIQANRALWLERWRGRLPGPELETFDRLGLRVAHVDPGPPAREPGHLRMPRPVLVRPARTVTEGPGQGLPSLRWALKIAAPAGPDGDLWGDVHFAASLGRALERLGQEVVVDRRESHQRRTDYLDDVVLTVRGLDEVGVHPGRVNLLWVISHPELIRADEIRRYDAAFAASELWSQHMTERSGTPVIPLLQATDPQRFGPDLGHPDGHGPLFVGNSRNVMRPIVADAIEAGLDVEVYGSGWEAFDLGRHLRGEYVDNEHLGIAYASAEVVLCDHWEDMARWGFVSNRVFDAVASGARVISDEVRGIDDLFGAAVQCYRTPDDLARLCGPEAKQIFPDVEARRRLAGQVAAAHSFEARARVLLETALRVRDQQNWVRPGDRPG